MYFFYNPQYDNTNIYVNNPDTEFVVEGNLTDEILGIKKACWVKMEGMMPPEFTGHFECDNCGWHGKLNERETDYNFCPGCGSKMSVGTPTIDEIDLSNPLLDEVVEMLEHIAYMRRITDECGTNTNKQNEKEK